MRTRRPLIALLLAGSLALASCGGSSGANDSGSKDEPTTTAEAPDTNADTSDSGTAAGAVDIADFAFEPESIEVKVGETVTFTNSDSATHTATSTDGPTDFDTGDLKQDDSKDVTFDEAGDYEYQCSIHDYMSGSVRVLE